MTLGPDRGARPPCASLVKFLQFQLRQFVNKVKLLFESFQVAYS